MKTRGAVPIPTIAPPLVIFTRPFLFCWLLFSLLPISAFGQDMSSLAQYRTAPQLFSRSDNRSSGGVIFDSLSADESALTQEFEVREFGDDSQNNREAHFRSYYWATQNEVGSPTEGEGLKDEQLVGQIAKQLTLYQTARAVTSWAKESRMAEEYRAASRGLKQCQDLTRVTVSRVGDGSLSFSKSGDRLLEFKIHASARTGVSPVLKLSNNWMLRYGVNEKETLVEYELNF